MSETSAAFLFAVFCQIHQKNCRKVAKIWAYMMDGVSRCYNDWSELVTMTLSIISLEIARYARKRRLDYCPTSLFNVLLSKLFYFDNCRFFID